MALALDGNNSGSSFNAALTLALTTTGAFGLICAACGTFGGAGAIASVVGTGGASGLAFTRRTALTGVSGEACENWYAPYTSNFSGNIVITPTTLGAGTTLGAVFGISGAATSSSFDANAPTTDTTGISGLTLTTANANDFVFTNYVGNVMTVGSGWNGIMTGTVLVEYQILSSPQTVTGTFASGVENLGILDAVVAAATGVGSSYGLGSVITKTVMVGY